jgi:hypothetical protein
MLDREVVGDSQAGSFRESMSLYEFYYTGGAFPAPPDPEGLIRPEATEWEFHYAKGSQQEAWETENPSVNSSSYYPINSELIAKLYLVPWDVESVQLYILLYHMLGKIYEGQRKVYDTVSSEGEFFRKSYYLNSCREGESCPLSQIGREGSKEFKKYIVGTMPIFTYNILVHFKNEEHNVTSIKLELKDFPAIGGKLYQFAFLDPGSRDRLRQLFNGIDIKQPFTAPDNYFGISLARYNPYTHVRVALQCTKASNNCVWPNPTPKYQVRTLP